MASEVDTSSIGGQVSLSDGERLPGVTVKAWNAEIERIVITEADGKFLIPMLRVGDYEVRFTLPGLNPEVRAVKLKLGEDARLEVAMTVAT